VSTLDRVEGRRVTPIPAPCFRPAPSEPDGQLFAASGSPVRTSARDFVCSEGADKGLSYPMHMMVRDGNGNVAYEYLDDIDAQPEIQMVHVSEDD
jgi:hypothetical protein